MKDPNLNLGREEIKEMKKDNQQFFGKERENDINPTFQDRAAEDTCTCLGERLDDAHLLLI